MSLSGGWRLRGSILCSRGLRLFAESSPKLLGVLKGRASGCIFTVPGWSRRLPERRSGRLCGLCSLDIALLGDKDGVAAILGTGSNSGLYLGGRIVRNIPAGGFILGDEGSGAWLGKMLLADYIKGLLPQDVETALREEFPGLDYPAVVSRVYGGEMPSRYLASFSLFLGRRKDCPYVRSLVTSGFRLFLERNVSRYGRPDLPLAAVGSVACVYGDILREVAAECGVCQVLTAPGAGDGLERYFSKMIE